ncbi:MAG: 16S rRNA (uracil(1498)-N(3))-methyltransferase [Bacteroidales bacterium]|nr:16S rRNA (uracil(1498)-N(3))-methyltransferase [Bacteroidales bacterium]
MHIFYTPDIVTEMQLPDEEAQHCIRVLRMTEGDEILLTDGKGSFYKALIRTAHPKHCKIEIVETITPDPLWNVKIEVAVAPTKNMDRMEWFTEKATEIGIDKIIPILCDHSERKALKEERLEKIAVSAMKQSMKPVLPEIQPLTPLDKLISTPFDGQKFIAHCYKEDKTELKDAYQKGSNALILIGPEGDFSEKEVEKAIQNGFVPVSLGRSRLRTETAALVACHTIQLLSE